MGRFHVWGCPTYTLEARLHNTGLNIPKWDPIIIREDNVGFSLNHSTLLAFVIILKTKYISPYYHVMVDEKFDSVHSNTQKNVESWRNLFTSSKDKLWVDLDEGMDPELDY